MKNWGANLFLPTCRLPGPDIFLLVFGMTFHFVDSITFYVYFIAQLFTIKHIQEQDLDKCVFHCQYIYSTASAYTGIIRLLRRKDLGSL